MIQHDLTVFLGSGPGLLAGAALVIVLCAMWLVLSWLNAGVIAALEARLRLAEARDRAFARVFRGQRPEEIAARIERLEALVAALPPRGLNEDQKRKLGAIGLPPSDASYLAIEYDSAHAETERYAHAFIEALAGAPGWNVVDRAHPRMAPLEADVSVGLARPGHPTPTEVLVLNALAEAGVKHGTIERTTPGMNAQIVVGPR